MAIKVRWVHALHPPPKYPPPRTTCVKPLMTADEVAAYLKVSRKTLFNQRARRDPPGALGVRIGRTVRWEPELLEAWIVEQRPETAS